MIQDQRKNPDSHQNLIDSSLGHARSSTSHKVSSESVRNLLRYFAHTHTERERHRHSHTYTEWDEYNNFLGGGNYQSINQLDDTSTPKR